MTADRFYTLVEESLGGGCHRGVLAEEEAARTTHVVFQAFGRTLGHGERMRLCRALPRRLAVELMACQGEPLADPVGWIACELQVDRDIASRRAGCVMATLRLVGAEARASLTP
jgi:hypothetical protein